MRHVLQGLRLQSFRDFEAVIVTNDPSLEAALGVPCAYVENKKPNLGAINRNVGVRMASHDQIVFLDSDVVLHQDALMYYAEGFTNFRNRAILGIYHWLPPMKIKSGDIEHWLDFINGRLEPIEVGYRHNIGRDGREQFFLQTHQDRLYCDYHRALHCLSGNMGISRACFEHAGGFDEELSNGVDGAFGLALCDAGHSWSYDRRIVGGHIYHPRYGPAMVESFRPRITARWHSDNSWIGQMTWGKTWNWED